MASSVFQPNVFQGNVFQVARVFQPNVFQSNVFQTDSGTFGALAPHLFIDGDTFYSPTIGGGNAAIAPPLFSDGDTFYSHTVANSSQGLFPTKLSNDNTFYTPSISVSSVSMAPAKYTDPDAFFPISVASKNSLLPATLVNANTFFAPSSAIAPDPTIRHTDPTYDDNGANIMVTSNLNDAHRLDINSGYLMGRTSAGRGPAQAISIGGVLSSASATFAGLPGSPTTGTISQVTDGTVNTPGATVAGGGSHHILAWFNGTAWTVIGV